MYGYEINKEEFEKLLLETEYNKLIPKLYYSDNQEEILKWCESVNANHYVPLLYFLIRHYSNNNQLYNSEKLNYSLRYMFRAIYLCVMHIRTYKEINKEFQLLHILCKKIPIRLQDFVNEQVLYDTFNVEKDYITKIVEEQSSKICPGFVEDNSIPDPYFIYNCRAGYPSYPAICVDNVSEQKKEEIKSKFVNNFGGRMQRYYEAIMYCNEKFRKVLTNFEKSRKLELEKFFLT